jgi:hypothetical protein
MTSFTPNHVGPPQTSCIASLVHTKDVVEIPSAQDVLDDGIFLGIRGDWGLTPCAVIGAKWVFRFEWQGCKGVARMCPTELCDS